MTMSMTMRPRPILSSPALGSTPHATTTRLTEPVNVTMPMNATSYLDAWPSQEAHALTAEATVRPLVSVDEAWHMHRTMMHAGWRTVADTFKVRLPDMPPCSTAVYAT